MLSLTLGAAPSFGAFAPATARNYDATGSATVVSTAGNATLSVTDATHDRSGPPGQRHVLAAAGAAGPRQQRGQHRHGVPSLSETAGTPVDLLTYTGPTAGADPVTLGFRQAIGATDPLRAGSYSKTLTFTLSTTTP